MIKVLIIKYNLIIFNLNILMEIIDILFTIIKKESIIILFKMSDIFRNLKNITLIFYNY